MSAHLVHAVAKLRHVSVSEIARRLMVHDRTIRRWIDEADPQNIPATAAILLQLWLDGAVTGGQIAKARDKVKKRLGRQDT